MDRARRGLARPVRRLGDQQQAADGRERAQVVDEDRRRHGRSGRDAGEREREPVTRLGRERERARRARSAARDRQHRRDEPGDPGGAANAMTPARRVPAPPDRDCERVAGWHRASAHRLSAPRIAWTGTCAASTRDRSRGLRARGGAGPAPAAPVARPRSAAARVAAPSAGGRRGVATTISLPAIRVRLASTRRPRLTPLLGGRQLPRRCGSPRPRATWSTSRASVPQSITVSPCASRASARILSSCSCAQLEVNSGPLASTRSPPARWRTGHPAAAAPAARCAASSGSERGASTPARPAARRSARRCPRPAPARSTAGRRRARPGRRAWSCRRRRPDRRPPAAARSRFGAARGARCDRRRARPRAVRSRTRRRLSARRHRVGSMGVGRGARGCLVGRAR